MDVSVVKPTSGRFVRCPAQRTARSLVECVHDQVEIILMYRKIKYLIALLIGLSLFYCTFTYFEFNKVASVIRQSHGY
jgi:hypothetical protein